MIDSPLYRRLILAAAFGLSLSAAPGIAQAFTMDNSSGTNSDGSAKYVDPDERLRYGSSSGQGTTIQQGNTTFQFGNSRQGTFDQRYDSRNMFDPVGRPDR